MGANDCCCSLKDVRLLVTVSTCATVRNSGQASQHRTSLADAPSIAFPQANLEFSVGFQVSYRHLHFAPVYIFLQDNRGAKRAADLFVSISLLQEVDGSFRLHDLLLDFVRIKSHGEDALVTEAVERQSMYLGRLDVLRAYHDQGETLGGLYSLISLWRKLTELSGNQRREVDVYNRSLRELGDDESADTADMYQDVAWLFRLQVCSGVEVGAVLVAHFATNDGSRDGF